MRMAFLDWMYSDNVVQKTDGLYYTQCTQYVGGYSLLGLYRYFVREYWQYQ